MNSEQESLLSRIAALESDLERYREAIAKQSHLMDDFCCPWSGLDEYTECTPANCLWTEVAAKRKESEK